MLFQMRRASQHAARCLSKYRIWSRLDARLIRRLISGDAGTCIGEQIALAAAPIIAVLLLGAGAGETGLLQTALTLPFLVFAIPAGLMTDRLPRARLMTWAETIRAASLLLLLLFIQMNMLTWPGRCSRFLASSLHRRLCDGGVQRCGAGARSRASPRSVAHTRGRNDHCSAECSLLHLW